MLPSFASFALTLLMPAFGRLPLPARFHFPIPFFLFPFHWLWALAHDDFHTPIARFGHRTGSLNQGFALAAAGGLNDSCRDSALNQQVAYPEGALQGQRVVVLIGAHEIGMADDGDLRRGSCSDIGGYPVDCTLGVGV